MRGEVSNWKPAPRKQTKSNVKYKRTKKLNIKKQKFSHQIITEHLLENVKVRSHQTQLAQQGRSLLSQCTDEVLIWAFVAARLMRHVNQPETELSAYDVFSD